MNTTPIRKTVRNLYDTWKWLLWGLRWTAIVVFGLLFCVGVFFALPWKILAALAVVPPVGIFVPRRIQPWCWAVMTAGIVALVVWVYLPQDDTIGQWRTYRFHEDFARLLQVHRIENTPNAATRYETALSVYDEDIFPGEVFGEDALLQTSAGPWNRQDFPHLAEWLAPLEAGIPGLIEAAATDQCRFPVPADMLELRGQLKRLNQLKGWSHLLIRSANSDLQVGRPKQALEKMLTVPGIARHLYQQQTLFDQAGAFYVEQLACRALKRYVVDYAADPNELVRILSAVQRVDPGWPDAWDSVVAHEKLMAKNIAALLYEIDENGRTRIHRNAILSVGEGMGYPVSTPLRLDIVRRAATLALWLSVPLTPERAGQMIDREFDTFSELARRGTPAPVLPIQYAWRFGLNPKSAAEWLARHQMSYFSALNNQYTSHLAGVRALSILVELKRYFLAHGRWPEDLADLSEKLSCDDLTDPVGNAPFVYRRTETGFVLYGLGPNGIDDGGRRNAEKQFDDAVYWPLDRLTPTTSQSKSTVKSPVLYCS